MNAGITVTITGTNAPELAAQLRSWADILNGGEVAATTPARRGKAAAAAEPETGELDFLNEGGETIEYTKEQLLKGFAAYAKKAPANREKAIKLLGKYKVKSVHDLPEEKYAEVMAVLEA